MQKQVKNSITLANNPFWEFSIEIYRHNTVEKNLLLLQNRHGLNINIILFCCWHAITHKQLLAFAGLKQLLTRIAVWHQQVVLPLRQMRMRLKQLLPLSLAIRQAILKQELFAEQIEQLIIATTLISTKPKTSLQPLYRCCKNILSYYQLLEITLTPHDCDNISAILTIIFDKIALDEIVRYCGKFLNIK